MSLYSELSDSRRSSHWTSLGGFEITPGLAFLSKWQIIMIVSSQDAEIVYTACDPQVEGLSWRYEQVHNFKKKIFCFAEYSTDVSKRSNAPQCVFHEKNIQKGPP